MNGIAVVVRKWKTKLFASLSLLFVGCSMNQERHKVNYTLDEQNRPLEIYSYYNDSEGSIVRDGDYYKWDWMLERVYCETYEDGKLLSSSSEGRHYLYPALFKPADERAVEHSN